MPARFQATVKAVKDGLAHLAVPAAVKNIEMWEEHVATLDVSGAKGLHADLDHLKKLLQHEPLDGAAVGKLLHKIAGETTRIAGRAEGKNKAHVHELAEALTEATKDAEPAKS